MVAVGVASLAVAYWRVQRALREKERGAEAPRSATNYGAGFAPPQGARAVEGPGDGVDTAQRRRSEHWPFESWAQLDGVVTGLGLRYRPMVSCRPRPGVRPSEWIALEHRDVNGKRGSSVLRRAFPSGQDTSGEVFESTNWLDPQMAGPPPHVHPDAEESSEVIEGSLDVFKDGQWTTVRPGETATVPVGVPHTLRNASDAPATIVTRNRPAGRSEAFFRHMHTLIEQGKIKRLPPKEPRSAIYAAMLVGRYPDEIRPTGPCATFSRRWRSSGRRFDSSSSVDHPLRECA